MNKVFQNIKAVGFDLDGTLYASTADMDEKFLDLFIAKVLEKRPELGTIGATKKFVEEKYGELESRKKTLEAIGYENASQVMQDILREADAAEFLHADTKLIALLDEIKRAKVSVAEIRPWAIGL